MNNDVKIDILEKDLIECINEKNILEAKYFEH